MKKSLKFSIYSNKSLLKQLLNNKKGKQEYIIRI